MLKRISYCSIRRDDVSDDDVREAIAARCAATNAGNGITGCLWFGPGIFVQVLEGRHSVLEETVRRIARDPRHEQVRVLSCSQAVLRLFEAQPLKLVDAGACPEAGSVASSIAAALRDDAPPLDVVIVRPGPFVPLPPTVVDRPELAVAVPSLHGVIAYQSPESLLRYKSHSRAVMQLVVELLSGLVTAVPVQYAASPGR